MDKSAWQTWLDTVDIPCEVCGYTWHKHPESCPHYKSSDLERCKIRHTPFLRSITPDKPRDWSKPPDPETKWTWEYECNFCCLPAFTSREELPHEPHPLCLQGIHHWEDYCGCCHTTDQYCSCGAKRQHPAQESD